jgi:hypothetical protein
MDAIGETNCWRYPGGYQWLRARGALSSTAVAESDMILTTGLPETTYWVESYNPPPNLFLEFAETPDTEEGRQTVCRPLRFAWFDERTRRGGDGYVTGRVAH